MNPTRLLSGCLAAGACLLGPWSARSQTMLIDFGGTTAGTFPDASGNYWNQFSVGGLNLALTNIQGTATGFGFVYVSGVGFLNGNGVLPNAALGLFNVSSVVVDGASVNDSVSVHTNRLYNLNALQTYDITVYGARSNTATRATTYTVTGANSATGVLTNSGTGIGTGGANYNNDKTLTLKGITPLTTGGTNQIFLTYSSFTGGFGYLNAMEVIGYVPYTNGTVTLSSAKTYPGNTVLNGGAVVNANATGALGGGSSALEVGSGGAALSLGASQVVDTLIGTGNLALNTGTNSLVLNGASSTVSSYYSMGSNLAATYSGVLSGSGQINKAGAGTLVLANSNTFSGSVSLNAGTLTLGHTNALQKATLDTTYGGGGGVVFGVAGSNTYNVAGLTGNRALNLGSNSLNVAATAGSSFYDGALSGTGSLIKSGVNTFTIRGSNSLTGQVVILGGSLQVSDDGPAGGGYIGGTSGITNDGTLVYNLASVSRTYSNAITGAGSLTKIGAATLTLSGSNSYAGSTRILAGVLQVGSGGTSGQLGSGNVTNNATLVFNRSDSMQVGNFVAGTGSVIVAGSGSVSLANANTYSGSTIVSNGTLVVNGSIASSALTVASGGTLGGTGLVGSTFLDNGAHLAPGNSPGILRVTNDLTLSASSQLDFEIGAITNARSYYDAVVVTGGLALDGVLNISNWAGGFGATSGTNKYALFDYTTLYSDNGLELGSVPTNLAYQVTTGGGQVSLGVKEFNTAASFASNLVSTTLTLNFGTNTQSFSSNSLAFAIFNGDLVDLMLGLDLTNFTAAAGPFSVGGGLFSSLLAGSNQAFTAWMDLGTVGIYSNVLTFQLGSATSGFLLSGVTPDQTLTLILQGEVVAIPEPGSLVALLAVAGSMVSRRRR